MTNQMTKQTPNKNDQPTKRRTQQKSDQVLLKVKLLSPDAKMPQYAHPGDIGMDVYATDVEYDSTTDTYVYHTVKSGDTNSKIAKQYGITVANILSMNKSTYPTISAGFIRVGWKLRVK